MLSYTDYVKSQKRSKTVNNTSSTWFPPTQLFLTHQVHFLLLNNVRHFIIMILSEN